MTVMWSMSSFGLYLLNYLNKYLEGSIYEVNYSEGLAGSLAIIVGAKMYAAIGKKLSFIISLSLAFLSGFGMFILENKIIIMPDTFQ